MSMAMKQARARYGATGGGAFIGRARLQGDPGLFGFLGNVAKGVANVLPGPVGAIARTALGAAAGGGGAPSSGGFRVTSLFNGGFPSAVPVATPPIQERRAPAPINLPGPIGGPGTGFPQPFASGGRISFGEQPQQSNGRQAGTQLACPSGYHPNKSSYFLKDGTFVPEGSKCVKNRRTNPLNPRAASRSIRRLESAKKAVRRLDRVQIKCKRCGCARCKC